MASILDAFLGLLDAILDRLPSPSASQFCKKEVPHHFSTTALCATERAENPGNHYAECVVTGPKCWSSCLPFNSDLHHRCVYVSFVYAEFDTAWRRATCTRDELIKAYETLLADHKALEDALVSTRMVLSGLAVMPTRRLPSKVATGPDSEEGCCRERLQLLRLACEKALERLNYAVENLGQFLAFLSLCEDHGFPLHGYFRWDGRLDEHSVRFPEKRERMNRYGWACDDYPFRTAKLINASETPDEVMELHIDLDTLTREYLAFKGYADTPPAVVARSPLPRRNGDDLPPPYEV